MTSQQSPEPSGLRKGLNIATASIGGVAIVFALANPVFAVGPSFGFFGSNDFINEDRDGWDDSDANNDDDSASNGDSANLSVNDPIDLTGITDIDIDVDRPGDLNVSFDSDIDEAEFTVSNDTSIWKVETDEETLDISAQGSQSDLGQGIRDSFDMGSREYQAQLVLPEAFNDGSLNLEISGPAMLAVVDGAFSTVDLDMGAGKFTFNGTARVFNSEIGAGELIADAADVDQLDVEVSTGHAQVSLTGATPSNVDVKVSAGAAELKLPADSYRVTTDVGLGKVENNLTTDKSSPHRVHATVSVGKVTLNE